MPDIKQTPEEKTKALYDATSKDYDVGTYDDFKVKLQDPTKRQAFYKVASSDYDLGNFDDFESKLGFKKKVSTSPLAPLPEEKPQMFGDGSQDQFTPQKDVVQNVEEPVSNAQKIATRIPQGSSQDHQFEFKDLDQFKNTGDPNDAGDPNSDAEVIKQQNLKDAKTTELAKKADKEGFKTFKDAYGKEQLTSQHFEKQNIVENFADNLYNGFLELPKGAATMAKMASYGNPVYSKILEDTRQGIEDSKEYIPQNSQKNIIDNPSDPLAYSALFGQLTGYVLPALATGGIGTAVNLSSKGLMAAQAMTNLTQNVSISYQSSKDAGLSDNGASAMTLVTAPVVTALDMVGMGKILNNGLTQKLIQKTGFEAIQEVTENFTKKFTPDLAKKAVEFMSIKTPDIIKRATSTGATEGVTELGQEGHTVGMEAVYNTFFKDKDEHGFNLDDWQKRLVMSGAGGLVGGGAFGLAPRARQLNIKKDQLTNDLNKEGTPESVKVIIQQEIEKTDQEIEVEKQNTQQEIADHQEKQAIIEDLKTKGEDLDSQLVKEDLSPETKTVLENQKTEIDSQLSQLQNEKGKKTTEENNAQESTETPAIQEGQQLEEKLVEHPIKKEYEDRKSNLDESVRHKDISTLENGDYVAVKSDSGTTYTGFVKSIGSKNVVIESAGGGMGGNDITISELKFKKDNVDGFYKPKPIENREIIAPEQKVPDSKGNSVEADQEISGTQQAIIDTVPEIEEGQKITHEGYKIEKFNYGAGNPQIRISKKGDPNNILVAQKDSTTKEALTRFIERENENAPPTPPVENNIETGAKEPNKKERSFPKQIIEEAVKEGISEETKTYIPITNKITNEEANKFIQDKGVDQALDDVRDTKNDMKAPVRVALAENIIKQSNKAASEATNQEDKNKHLDRAIKSADFISQYLTEIGQGVQAASMYAKLSPEGVLRYIKREYSRTRKKAIAEVSEELKDNKEVIDNINKEAIEKVLGTDKVKKAIEGKVKNASDSRKKTVKKATDFLEKLKIDTKGKANDITFLLPATAWNGAIETIQKSLELGLSVVESIDVAVEYVKGVHKDEDGHNLEWDEKGFRKQFSSDLSKYEAAIDPAGSTKKGIADLGINIQEIIKEHYSKVDTAKKTLVQKILDNTDLTEIDAKEIAKNIEEEFDRITSAEKKKALIKFLSAKSIIPSKKPQFYEEIIKLSNIGALSEADWHKLYAHKMDLPSLSEVDAKKLMDLADKVQTAKDGFQKNRATQDLLAFQEKLKGISWGEVGSAIWYANILSGLSTQTTNAYSGFMEVMGELWVSSVRDPKNFPFLMKNLYEGWGRGKLEAASVLKTGYQPEKGPKIESPALLERVNLPGGKWNPFNYSKYVSRLMSAVDIFHYHALKEMRAGELAMKMAVMEGKDQPTQSIKTRAIEILNKTKEREVQARTQALEEGLKGQDLDRRIFELMEQSRPAEITEDAADFAAHGTFNYEPEGLLGAITAGFNYVSSLAEVKGVRPLQFIVPFTRVIANVTNRSLDWTPWGLVRGAKGQIGYENKLTKDRFVKKYTQEERQREYIKAVTGTLAMAALWAMTDDEDGLFEITADGTGDRKKNYELQGSGWRPYSIRIGDTWFEYKNTPLSIPFAMIGFSRDAIKYKGEKDIEAKFSIAAMGGVKYIMDMNFLSSLTGFFSVFSKDNPDADASFTQRAAKEFGRTAKGFVVPNLFTQASRSLQEIYDLPMKRANGIMEEFTRDMPVLRDNQENLYNALGDPVIADQTRKFLPFKPKNDEDNRVWDIIIENKAWIGLPSKETQLYDKKMRTERTFADNEYNEFARLSGQYTKKAIQDHYDDLRKNDSHEDVKKAIEKLKKKARERAKRDMAKKINK